MSKIDMKLIEKYFNSETTPEENDRVLKWFGTPQGEKFLEEQLNTDIGYLAKDKNHYSGSEIQPDSSKILSAIYRRIKTGNAYKKSHKKDRILPYLKAAAVILVFLANALLYQYVIKDNIVVDETTELQPVHYSTSDGQQFRITLRDSTIIRINSNSEIWIPGDFDSDSRTIKLSGEAYFEVMSDPDRPFIINANESVVEVLGTAFNVKSYRKDESVQVAVIEGSVAFRNNTNGNDRSSESVILSGGQFAYLDILNNQITIEDFGVLNYLTWMRGNLVFDELSLDKVCIQLNRLYKIQCLFDEESLKQLKLTSDFSNDSLEKTLSVISLTLGIEHRLENDTVIWHR
jgi:transmembrane sensor